MLKITRILINLVFLVLLLGFERMMGLPVLFLLLILYWSSELSWWQRVSLLLFSSLLLATAYVVPFGLSWVVLVVLVFGAQSSQLVRVMVASPTLQLLVTNFISLGILWWWLRDAVSSQGLIYSVLVWIGVVVGGRVWTLWRKRRTFYEAL